MSIARSIRRKAERERLKAQRPQVGISEWNIQRMSAETGVNIDVACQWLEDIAKKMQDEMSESMARLLWEAEDYIATANLVIMLHAILQTFGNLKTVQKGMPRLMRNLSSTMDMVDEKGIPEAAEMLKQYGVELVFDEFDINGLFEDPGKSRQIMARMKARWGIER